MSSLLWRSWPRITLEESQILYNHFAKQGPVVGFKSARRHLIGSIGQGIVVFKDANTIDTLLQGQESVELDLQHLFEPTDKIDKETILESSDSPDNATAEAKKPKPSQWIIRIRNAHKEPESVSIESMIAKRKLKIVKESALFDRFLEEGLNFRVKVQDEERQLIKDVLQNKMLDIRQVEQIRGRKPNKSPPEAQTLTSTTEDATTNIQERASDDQSPALEPSSAVTSSTIEDTNPDTTNSENVKPEA